MSEVLYPESADSKKKAKPERTPTVVKPQFIYYKLDLKLVSEQLGTATEASIYAEHILNKAKKQIAEANTLRKKVTKALEKYKGSAITEQKEVAELQAAIRRYHEVLGRVEDIPTNIIDILEYSRKLDEEFNDLVKAGEHRKATVFLRNKEGHAIVSSHMILGNLKENLKIHINNNTGSKESLPLKTKTSVSETLALDVKPVEDFVTPSNDVVRLSDGTPFLLERPIRFQDNFGNTQTAIVLSEVLPIGTEYSLHLRVRAESPFAANDAAILRNTLDLGKSNGIGQWRGSGSKGQYWYKLNQVDSKQFEPTDGWN